MALFNVSRDKTILMIANPNNWGLLFDYLVGSGFGVKIALKGEKALPKARDFQPDIILLDVLLPGIDGFETCRLLKAQEPTKNIPVIFIDARNSPVDKMRGFSLGAVDYITKPLQSEEMLVRLRTHLMLERLKNNLKESNRRLQEEVIEREKLIEELDSFAHTVAHDIKNPLGVMINYAQFISGFGNQMTHEQIKQYADVIVQNGQKMNSIINELLLLASARKEDIDIRRLDMAQIVEEVKVRLEYMIEQFEADVVIPDYWPQAVGYAPWVEEVWTNYISNAMKYGGEPPRVELGALLQSDGMIQFRVWDNGKGLAPEAQAKLFKEFTRLEQDRAEGHGLGLSIVQRIVERLGGTVGVTSDNIPGQGCVFYFTLPQYDEDDLL